MDNLLETSYKKTRTIEANGEYVLNEQSVGLVAKITKNEVGRYVCTMGGVVYKVVDTEKEAVMWIDNCKQDLLDTAKIMLKN